MFTLSNAQKKYIEEFNQQVELNWFEKILDFDFIKYPFKLFDADTPLSDDYFLRYITNEFYKENQRIINLSEPQDIRYVALRYCLYNPPHSFAEWNNQDVKDLIMLYKAKFIDESTREYLANTETTGWSGKDEDKLKYQAGKALLETLGIFKSSKINAEILKKFDLENRGTEFYEEFFNGLNYNMLTPNALEQSKHIASLLGFRQGNAIEVKLQKAAAAQSKYSEEIKQILKSQGLHIDELMNKQDEALFFGALNLKMQSEMLSKMAAQAQQAEIKAHFDAINDIGKVIIQLGQVTGSQDLQKFGALSIASSQAVFAACQITGLLGVASVTGISMISPITAIASGVLATISIFSSGDNDEGMAAAFNEMFSALNIIYQEMHQQFNQLHLELFQVFNVVHQSIRQNQFHFLQLSDKLDAITKFQEFSHKEIIGSVHANLLGEISKIIYQIKSDNLPEALSDKIKYLEELDYGANSLAFDVTLNNPNKDPSYLFLDKSIEQQIATRPLDQNIAFLTNYARGLLNLSDDILPNGKDIPNLSLFFSIANVAPSLLFNIVNEDAKKVGMAAKTLDNMLKTSVKISNAINALNKHDIIGKMLEAYSQEIEKFNVYIKEQNDNYSRSLGLATNIDNQFSNIVAGYSDIPITKSCQWKMLSTISYDTYTACADKAYILAEKLGLGYTNSYCHSDEHPFGYSSILISNYLNKATQETFALTCPPHPRMMEILAEKLQSLRGEFLQHLISQDIYQEHINKLKVYEQLIHLYSLLTGGSPLGTGYIEAFNQYINHAKHISAHEPLSVLPGSYFAKQNIWYNDDSLINKAYNDNKLTPGIYAEIALATQQSLNFTSILIKNIMAPKQETAGSKIIENLKGFFSFIADAKDELVLGFTSAKQKQLEKFDKYFDQANTQIEAIDKVNVNSPEVLQELYCNVFCTDKILKFNVEWYLNAMTSDQSLAVIHEELNELTQAAVCCNCL